MDQLVTLKFVKSYGMYHAGTIASFYPEQAVRLYALGIVEAVVPERSPSPIRDVARKIVRKASR